MKTRAWLIAAMFGGWMGAVHAAEWQVVLLKPRGCNDCTYLEEILKRSGQLQQATLQDGKGGNVTARIVRRASTELSATEWTEVRALPGFDEPAWHRRAAGGAAQVLLKRDGIVASAGDIADSADLRTARFPLDLVMPDVGRDVDSVRDARATYIGDLYLRTWNLDWFYQLALDPSLRTVRARAWPGAAPAPLSPPLAAANVFLMSTASGAADNEIFNALRIEEIRDVLAQSLAFDPARLRIFYGGDNAVAASALEVRNGRFELIRRTVDGATPFTPDAVTRIFEAIRARPGSRNLLVLVGHGNPDGAGMWASPTALAPAALRALHERGGGDDVLVSGNCYGGVMARATSCGFFGARPDLIATGCQADAVEVAQSRDYLHMFFTSLVARRTADADGDGAITFAEAHWYASSEGDPRNVTYTSVDALADAWFDAHPEQLPRTISVREVQALANKAAPGEARALRALLSGYDGDLALPLHDMARQANRWRPESGAPRAMAGQLARRLLYLQAPAARSAELARLQACENRSIAAFIEP